MKNFDDIVSALGLSATKTVVRGGTQDGIVYEAVWDSGKTQVAGIRIDVQHKLSGYLNKVGWDPQTATPSTSDGPMKDLDAQLAAEGHAIALYCDQEVMEVGSSCRLYVACQWLLLVKSCGDDGMDLAFGHESDKVTTWVAQMAYVLMNDFQNYLE